MNANSREDEVSGPALQATPVLGYLIEPMLNGPTSWWDGHHATNPCAIRLSRDPRVFLGYRAGGTGDFFRIKGHDVWRSHLGLAVLNPTGDKVLHRLPLPVLETELDFALPQTEAEFAAFKQGPHAEAIAVLHDFRLWEDGDWFYCIYHEGAVDSCFDCIVRMRTTDFLARIGRSIELSAWPQPEIINEWRKLWWAAGVWQPAGHNGTNRIYASTFPKNDIVFIRLGDGSLRMLHRPLPDIAIIDTEGKTCAPATADGLSRIGIVQSSIRPGFADNSHIGNNGLPTRAKIGDVEVYIDVIHGVQNFRISEQDQPGWDLEYKAYFRVLDYATGELLYYSADPIFSDSHPWRAYTHDGAWVSKLSHLRSVMFTGGQLPAEPDRNGLDDTFHAYVGLGDTAVGLAKFTLRSLLPPPVIAAIQARPRRRGGAGGGERGAWSVERGAGGGERGGTPHSALRTPHSVVEPLGAIAGWDWTIRNSPDDCEVQIARQLQASGEASARPVGSRPGYFDSDGLLIEPGCVVRSPDLGWLVVYKGLCWEEADGNRRTQVGYGLLLLDRENPERILYRSSEPLDGKLALEQGWTAGGTIALGQAFAARAESLLPARVRKETLYIYQHNPMPPHMVQWLATKAQAAAGRGALTKASPA